jgi:hypothetical protein
MWPEGPASGKESSVVKINGLRSKARVFAPEAFDPGQVVEFAGKRGVVWSLGYENGRRIDSRWVVVEDGGIELLMLDKKGSGKEQELSAYRWGERVEVRNAVAFKAVAFEAAEQFALAA